ncbi:MAG: DUF4192 family protein [Mobilicoccus sp.]|nr:DUF4192 family protein [Mobilicoccus sp.]
MTPCSVPELIVLLPYHVGFHLTDAIAVVGLRGDRLDLVERVDLDGWPLSASTTARLLDGVTRRGCDEVIVIAFHDTCDPAPALDGLLLAACHLTVNVRVMQTSDGRWRWYRCHGDRHEIHGWQELPEAASIPAVAEYVARGAAPFRDRSAVAQALRTRHPATARIGRRVDTHPTPSVAVGTAAWERLLDPTQDPRTGERRAADIVTALAFVRVKAHRDHILTDLLPFHDAPEDHGHIRGTLISLVQAAPDGVRVTALAVLAAWAWEAGDCALAGMAADEALDADPGHTLAGLVSLMLAESVRPQAG